MSRPPTLSLVERDRRALLQLLVAAFDPDAGAGSDAGADWFAVRDYAGVALSPVLLRGAQRSGTVLPASVSERLVADQRRLAAVYLHRQAALRAACGALDEAGIPFLVLKGAALAHHVYPDPLLRPMTDVDLWLAGSRLDDATRALHGLGYIAAPAVGFDAESGERAFDSDGPISMRVELHSPPRSLRGLPWGDFDAAWHESRPAMLGGFEARIPGHEQLLVHVVLHLARKNAFDTTLRQLLDAALLVRREAGGWNWSAMLQSWQSHRIESWMLLGLSLARDLLGAPVPEDLEGGLQTDYWRSMRELAEARLWDARFNRLPKVAGRMARAGSASGRMRVIRERLFGHYWGSGEPRDPMSVLSGGLRRMWYDLRFRVPGYLSELSSGRLRGAGLERAAMLERQRQELEQLAERPAEGTAGGPSETARDRPPAG